MRVLAATLLVAFGALFAGIPARAQTLSIGANSDGTGNATGKEGETIDLTVKLAGLSLDPVTVSWRYASGGTAESSDYSHDGGQNLRFSVGQTSKTVSIDLANDDRHEAEEEFHVELHSANQATISRSRAKITIAVDPDNPDLPSFTVEPALSVDEDAGTAAVSVVHAAFPSDVADITIAYQMTGVTATAGVDFTAASGTLTFPKGSRTTQTIDVPIADDALVEDDETFEVQFGTPSTGSIEQSPAKTVVTILDNEPNATGKPAVSGVAQVGMTLTASTSDIMDANGLTGAAFSYQWIRVDDDGSSNPTDVGTDSDTYTPTPSDLGKQIKVR